jgi:putative redox protein
MAMSISDFASGGGHRLPGRLETPETTPRGWAVFAHCFTCGKESLAASRVARALSRAGIGVLRLDFAGTGTSEAHSADPGFAADVDDLVAAAEAMTAAGMAPSLLVGHSLGGAAAICAAAKLPAVRAVATIASPADASHVLDQLAPADRDRIMKEGQAEAQIAGRSFVIKRSFIEQIGRHTVEKCAAHLHRPLLIMHAPGDELVGIDHASRIFVAARHPKSFISLDTADHLLTRPEDANYAALTIGAWVTRYLPPLVEEIAQAEPAKGVTAIETGSGMFQVAIGSGRHQFFADEPVSAGGLDSGPAPYDLVSAGLAACTAMTMRLYAERKGIPLERARVTVDHSRIADMAPADRFTRVITLEGPLDAGQRASLLEIAERCPVDLTLVRGSDVQTRLANEKAIPATVLAEQD